MQRDAESRFQARHSILTDIEGSILQKNNEEFEKYYLRYKLFKGLTAGLRSWPKFKWTQASVEEAERYSNELETHRIRLSAKISRFFCIFNDLNNLTQPNGTQFGLVFLNNRPIEIIQTGNNIFLINQLRIAAAAEEGTNEAIDDFLTSIQIESTHFPVPKPPIDEALALFHQSSLQNNTSLIIDQETRVPGIFLRGIYTTKSPFPILALNVQKTW